MFPSNIPPGLLYIVHSIPRLATSLLPVLIAHHFFVDHLHRYVWVVAYIIAVPSAAVLTSVNQYLREERDIERLGARRIPQVPTHWPGGVEVLQYILETFDKGYIGNAWENFGHNLGATFNVRMFWEDLIVTTEPENLKTILATDFDNYEKGRNSGGIWSQCWALAYLIPTATCGGMTRPFFARERVMDYELFDRHAETAILRLKERFAQGEAVNFQDVISRFTLDSATEFLFGSCTHSLFAPLPYAYNSPNHRTLTQPHPNDAFSAAFNQAQTQIALRCNYAEFWQLAEFWKDKTQDSMNVINAYIDPILKEALAKKGTIEPKSPLGGDCGDGYTLLDHLVQQTDDPAILRDEALNIMIAGRDTTTATLTFLVYCLSQHPRILARLREEILTQVGPKVRPTSEDMKECKYLRAVINETLRLYPPVPLNIRRSVNATTWPAPDGGKPFYIPAGVEISYSVWLMHRRTDLWGPDAHEFDPDRFLDQRRDQYLTPNPFIFLPFNAGPRICLGQQFAYHEISFMLIRLLQAFDTITFDPDAQAPETRPSATWKTPSGRPRAEKIWPRSHLTLYSYGGLWLRMGEAQYTDAV